jgi:hypothetical protein
MIVVSDTTPLNYLILIESVHVLPALLGRVYAPSAVIHELAHPRSPEPVRRWTDSLPEWLTVQEPTRIEPSLRPDHYPHLFRYILCRLAWADFRIWENLYGIP